MDLPRPFPSNIHDLSSAPVPCTVPLPSPTFDQSGRCVLSSPMIDITSPDLPWPLPVRSYERFQASVLNRKPKIDEAGRSVYSVYSIRFEVLDVETDPIQHLASDFAFVTPGLLDLEVAQMSVNLYLPRQACVKANICECGFVALDFDQVELTKRFNTWLFELVLRKSPAPVGSVTRFNESPKGYYVLPLRADTKAPGIEFDWSVINSALTSGLISTRRSKCFKAGKSKLEAGDFKSEPAHLTAGQVIMRNGIFVEEDLEDAMISSCAHNGMLCFVNAMSKHLNGFSCIQGPEYLGAQTYADYYAVECEYQLKYKNQPFFEGRYLSRAANYLKRPKTEATKGPEVVPKADRSLELPPEICILHEGIKGQLCRGATRLPSVLYSLEIALLAAELRDLIGIPISCFKVLQALTSRGCQGDLSYEALEFLGDSLLKFAGSTYLFLEDSIETEEQLASNLYELVRNKTLYYCAMARSLTKFALVDPFAPNCWIPPGQIRSEVGQDDCSPARQQRQKFQAISCRTLADIVEALLGAYLMDGGLHKALQAMSWLCVPIRFPLALPDSVKKVLLGTTTTVHLYNLVNVDELEKMLDYHFKDMSFLAAALKSGSHNCPENSSRIYTRLVFLGNGILDYVITRYLLGAHPEQDEGKLTAIKHAVLTSENLAFVTILHGLHLYSRRISPALDQMISEYVHSFSKERSKKHGVATLCAPKALRNFLLSLAAAIYLDSNLDVEVTWRVLKPLLEPLLTPTLNARFKHPMKKLETLCNEKKWSLQIHVNELENCFQVEIWVNELVVGNSENEKRSVARRLAATMALQVILS